MAGLIPKMAGSKAHARYELDDSIAMPVTFEPFLGSGALTQKAIARTVSTASFRAVYGGEADYGLRCVWDIWINSSDAAQQDICEELQQLKRECLSFTKVIGDKIGRKDYRTLSDNKPVILQWWSGLLVEYYLLQTGIKKDSRRAATLAIFLRRFGFPAGCLRSSAEGPPNTPLNWGGITNGDMDTFNYSFPLRWEGRARACIASDWAEAFDLFEGSDVTGAVGMIDPPYFTRQKGATATYLDHQPKAEQTLSLFTDSVERALPLYLSGKLRRLIICNYYSQEAAAYMEDATARHGITARLVVEGQLTNMNSQKKKKSAGDIAAIWFVGDRVIQSTLFDMVQPALVTAEAT